MGKKQWIKIASMSAPIIALVVATLFGLDATVQDEITRVILQIVTIVGGAIGVGGVAANNDKDSQEQE
ncbi:hypothetical protein [Bacillus paralicheniformis]|uniref:hypothetical protein n=1 Tax=Bacillus paralicheniformis TaxID=1648923 RepID=UPI0011A48B4C|nr:hypothetical protein [Bacillus paralicheniformis]